MIEKGKCRNGNELASPVRCHSCICPSMIEKGKCRNGNELDWPIDIKKLFFACQPKSFKCKGNDEFTPFTGFGCADGGFPKCKGKNWNSLKCSDGTVIGYADAIKARLGDGCICEDGMAPSCVDEDVNPKKYPTCPNGEHIDLDVGTPGHLWDECEQDDEDEDDDDEDDNDV